MLYLMAKGIQNCWLYSVSSVLVSFILCSALVTTSSTNGVLQEAKFGPFNFTELEQALYDVELLRVPLPESALLSQGKEDYTMLVSRHGQRYACKLPWQPSPSDEHTVEEQQQPDMNITALLLPLQDRPCPIKTVGWWTYEYCHGQFVRQYHMEGGKVVGKTIFLGFYENETEWNREQVDRVQSIIDSLKDGTGPLPVTYHQVHFVNGTICESNKKPRTTEVLIRCSLSSDDKLYEVVEREMCSYTLIIHTAILCRHPLFVTGNGGRSHTLSCHPLLSQSDYQTYQERLGHSKRSADSPNTIEHKLNGDFQSFLSQFIPSQNRDRTQASTMEQPITPGEAVSNTHNIEQKPSSLNNGARGGREDIDSKVPTRLSSSDMKDLTVEKLTQEIEYAYKQLVASLDEQEDTDPTAARLKKSITSQYSEFDKLRKRKSMEEEVEEHLTEDMKNFEESKGDSPAKKERPAVKPYEVQGVRETQSSVDAPLERVGGEELVEEETFTVERLTDMEEAINKEIQEHLRENGIEGKADVKVVALPMNIMEMLMDEDSEFETDDEDDDTVKMILKFGKGQELISAKSQSELSRMLASLHSPPADERGMSTDEQRVRDLESSYDQVWGEQEEADKKRT